jgi:hypothetical protein
MQLDGDRAAARQHCDGAGAGPPFSCAEQQLSLLWRGRIWLPYPLDAAVMWKLCLGEPADLTHKKYARAGLEPRTFFSRVACQAHRATKAWFGLAFFTRVPVVIVSVAIASGCIFFSGALRCKIPIGKLLFERCF